MKFDGMSKSTKRCLEFLKLNGWQADMDTDDSDFISFYEQGNISIDIADEEIVFIDDTGDFLHIPTNYYALIGALLECKAIAMDYKTC